MNVEKAHYEESLNYLKDIANKKAIDRIKDEIDTLENDFKTLDIEKKRIEKLIKDDRKELSILEGDLKEINESNKKNEILEKIEIIKNNENMTYLEALNDKLEEISSSIKKILNPYKEKYFESHVKRVIAFKQNINIEDIDDNRILAISIIDKEYIEDEEYNIVAMAIKNMNSVLISSSVLSILNNCSRQNIHTMFLEKKIYNSVIGHNTAFKLLDVLE